jgi:hypothetical protein
MREFDAMPSPIGVKNERVIIKRKRVGEKGHISVANSCKTHNV